LTTDTLDGVDNPLTEPDEPELAVPLPPLPPQPAVKPSSVIAISKAHAFLNEVNISLPLKNELT
jgi:hypothetical protein